ncbi:hypothetical protein CA236_00990 [Sphingomonas sp. ABOLG]|nr:hypothetical protein CA236_00990 [Sphingomonas sp. ABOLG]
MRFGLGFGFGLGLGLGLGLGAALGCGRPLALAAGVSGAPAFDGARVDRRGGGSSASSIVRATRITSPG